MPRIRQRAKRMALRSLLSQRKEGVLDQEDNTSLREGSPQLTKKEISLSYVK